MGKISGRLRSEFNICEQQFGFRQRKGSTDAVFALKMLLGKSREGQKELECVFVDLEKVYYAQTGK